MIKVFFLDNFLFGLTLLTWRKVLSSFSKLKIRRMRRLRSSLLLFRPIGFELSTTAAAVDWESPWSDVVASWQVLRQEALQFQSKGIKSGIINFNLDVKFLFHYSYCLTISNYCRYILRRAAREKVSSSLEKIVQTQPRILIPTEIPALWTQILYRDHVPVKDCRPWYMNFAAHSRNCIIQIKSFKYSVTRDSIQIVLCNAIMTGHMYLANWL